MILLINLITIAALVACLYVSIGLHLRCTALEAAIRQRDHINEVCRADSAADEKWLMEPPHYETPFDAMVPKPVEIPAELERVAALGLPDAFDSLMESKRVCDSYMEKWGNA